MQKKKKTNKQIKKQTKQNKTKFGQYATILTEQAWSITHKFIYKLWIMNTLNFLLLKN